MVNQKKKKRLSRKELTTIVEIHEQQIEKLTSLCEKQSKQIEELDKKSVSKTFLDSEVGNMKKIVNSMVESLNKSASDIETAYKKAIEESIKDLEEKIKEAPSISQVFDEWLNGEGDKA